MTGAVGKGHDHVEHRAGFTLCRRHQAGIGRERPPVGNGLRQERICLFGGRYDVAVVIAVPCRIKAGGGIAYRDGKRRSFGRAVDTDGKLCQQRSDTDDGAEVDPGVGHSHPGHATDGVCGRSRRVGKRNAQHVGCPCTVLIIIPKRLCQAADAYKRIVALRQAEQAGCQFLRRGKLVRFHFMPLRIVYPQVYRTCDVGRLDAIEPFHADGKAVPVIFVYILVAGRP